MTSWKLTDSIPYFELVAERFGASAASLLASHASVALGSMLMILVWSLLLPAMATDRVLSFFGTPLLMARRGPPELRATVEAEHVAAAGSDSRVSRKSWCGVRRGPGRWNQAARTRKVCHLAVLLTIWASGDAQIMPLTEDAFLGAQALPHRVGKVVSMLDRVSRASDVNTCAGGSRPLNASWARRFTSGSARQASWAP